jgi:predicted GNAT family N-acyltransferase
MDYRTSFSSVLEQEQQYTVTVVTNDDVSSSNRRSKKNYNYILRGLTTPEEVDRWADFCASVFSYKASPPPAEYFLRHYKNDPYTIRMMTTLTTTDVTATLKNTTAATSNTMIDNSEISSSVSASDQQQPSHHQHQHSMHPPSLYIRVAMLEDEIVASCRIFFRTISLGGEGTTTTTPTLRGGKSATTTTTLQLLSAAGIGEVCTSSTHRNRGLAKALMENALAIILKIEKGDSPNMSSCSPSSLSGSLLSSTIQQQRPSQQQSQFQVSFLHCAPEFVHFYKRLGYNTKSQTDWSTLQWTFQTHRDHGSNRNHEHREQQQQLLGSIRLASFPQDAVRLQHLHQQYSEQRFVGCIVRSLSYWNHYLSKELEGSMYVLVVDVAALDIPTADQPQQHLLYNAQHMDNYGGSGDNGGAIIVAWLSIRSRGENFFQLREFGVDRERISTKAALESLLQYALDHQEQGETTTTMDLSSSSSSSSSSASSVVVTLSLPIFVLDEIRKDKNNDDDDNVAAANNAAGIIEDGLWKIVNEKESDNGWMYRVIDQDAVDAVAGGFQLNSVQVNIDANKTNSSHCSGAATTTTSTKTSPIHFIWPSDSF